MESLRGDGSYTGRLMLCEGLVKARDEHISQTNTEHPDTLVAHRRHTK